MADRNIPLKSLLQFWTHVSNRGQDAACWEWQRDTIRGYGRLSVRSRVKLAHRVAWELTNGPIPNGLCVMHACDNRACCNPKHLSLGTYADNNADMRAKDRHARGARSRFAKLTEKNVAEMRHLRAQGLKLDNIAQRFGVSVSTTSTICSRKWWKHVA